MGKILRFCAGLTLLFLAGCIHTEINQDLNAPALDKPYRKILICSLSKDPRVGAEVEAALARDLARHHIIVETGRQVLHPEREGTVDAAIVRIKQDQVDGILITERVEVPEPPSTVKNVLLAPSVEKQPPLTEEKESFTNVREFTAAYLAMLKEEGPAHTEGQLKASASEEGIVGRVISIHAQASLLGLRENQIVWSTGGLIDGSPRRPIQEFIDSFSKTIETSLVRSRFIPH